MQHLPQHGNVSIWGVFHTPPFMEHPGWTGLDAQVLRGDTVAALDWINRNRVDLVAVVERCAWRRGRWSGWNWRVTATPGPRPLS